MSSASILWLINDYEKSKLTVTSGRKATGPQFKALEKKGHHDSLVGTSELFVRIKQEFQKTVEQLSAEMVNHD